MTLDRKASQLLSKIAVKAIQDKLGKDITLIDFEGINGSLFDFYVICTANSPSHADTLAEYIREKVKQEMKLIPHSEEGLQNCNWVLLDYFDVIIHIFLPEAREFYNIENMWKDVKTTHYPNVNE
ncbi:MAG: ribosome silencing factor [Bacteroidales bacterium]|nr:ribosome silencing factor [Bacteroidales bacterium]MBQ7984294.1 ribosome silencing factor [Bacteroidales bacterium]